MGTTVMAQPGQVLMPQSRDLLGQSPFLRQAA